ncbi:MAG: glycosyltransferase family 4 protein [Flavobacterium sp.]|nr:glycosyltransferase family 4 protein [Flavobacterium sp.]
MKIKLLYITNIPALYRQKRFNTMAKIFPEYGIDFEVLYMARTEPNRKWIIPHDSYQYKHAFFKGIHPTIGGFFAHFNPGLLLRLLKNDYNIAIVGGMASPTHWFAPFFINSKKKQVMSVESNLHSVERTKGFGAWMKKILLGKADVYQITGNPQIEYIKFFNPESSSKQFIRMPNLIDEDIFVDQVSAKRIEKLSLRRQLGVNENTQLWVLPARLIEIKGILPFLALMKGIENVKLFILGDGPLQAEIEDFVKQNKLPVICVGFVQQDTIVDYYAAADLFVLPSIKDPSPLSPIEAIASGLPVLVSSRIGNLEDVLKKDFNGWAYDPITEMEEGREIVKEIAALPIQKLSEMGNASKNRYFEFFDTKRCIALYAEQITKIFNS